MKLAIDIDDTLCYTTRRRMEMFQERFGNPEELSSDELIEKYEIVQRVPYRQTPEAQTLIEELISDDENWINLQPIPGGRDALYELHQHTEIIYLTSRQEHHRKKTHQRLTNNKFPDYPLIMRPHETSDAVEAHGQFMRKSRYLITQYPEIGAIIDNSISLSKQLHHMHYQGKHILFGHTSPKIYPTSYLLPSRNNVKKIIDILP